MKIWSSSGRTSRNKGSAFRSSESGGRKVEVNSLYLTKHTKLPGRFWPPKFWIGLETRSIINSRSMIRDFSRMLLWNTAGWISEIGGVTKCLLKCYTQRNILKKLKSRLNFALQNGNRLNPLHFFGVFVVFFVEIFRCILKVLYIKKNRLGIQLFSCSIGGQQKVPIGICFVS